MSAIQTELCRMSLELCRVRECQNIILQMFSSGRQDFATKNIHKTNMAEPPSKLEVSNDTFMKQTPKRKFKQSRVLSSDSRQMSELSDNSVHLAITSPPYWQLKDYGSENQIGFHLSEFNELLLAHIEKFKLKKDSTIFVPLCGKSIDLIYLAKLGCRVIGIELSEIAVNAFFMENSILPREIIELERLYQDFDGEIKTLVQVSGLALCNHVQLGPQHRQHRQQLARAKFGRAAAFKARQRLRRNARFGRDIALLEAQQLATRGDGLAEFLKGLHGRLKN